MFRFKNIFQAFKENKYLKQKIEKQKSSDQAPKEQDQITMDQENLVLHFFSKTGCNVNKFIHTLNKANSKSCHYFDFCRVLEFWGFGDSKQN